jgi:hypothetical protein
MYNETLRQSRTEYVDAALAEMNAVCNVIENDEMDKVEMKMKRAQELGEIAQQKYWDFVQVARSLYPDNPALSLMSLDEADYADEN